MARPDVLTRRPAPSETLPKKRTPTGENPHSVATDRSRYKITLGEPVVSSMATIVPRSGEFKSMNTQCEVSTCTCPVQQTRKKTIIDLTVPASGLGALDVSSMKAKGEISAAQGSQNSQCQECYSVYGECLRKAIVDGSVLKRGTSNLERNDLLEPITVTSLRQNERGSQKSTDGRSRGLDRCC